MLSQLRKLILVAIIAGGALMFAPEPKQAVANDGYWTNYWRWYDNDYQPYYNRRYHSNYLNSRYGYDYDRYYNRDYNRYDRYDLNDRYYGNRYYGNRYYDYGYDYPYRRYRNSVDIGGLRLEWR